MGTGGANPFSCRILLSSALQKIPVLGVCPPSLHRGPQLDARSTPPWLCAPEAADPLWPLCSAVQGGQSAARFAHSRRQVRVSGSEQRQARTGCSINALSNPLRSPPAPHCLPLPVLSQQSCSDPRHSALRTLQARSLSSLPSTPSTKFSLLSEHPRQGPNTSRVSCPSPVLRPLRLPGGREPSPCRVGSACQGRRLHPPHAIHTSADSASRPRAGSVHRRAVQGRPGAFSHPRLTPQRVCKITAAVPRPPGVSAFSAPPLPMPNAPRFLAPLPRGLAASCQRRSAAPF